MIFDLFNSKCYNFHIFFSILDIGFFRKRFNQVKKSILMLSFWFENKRVSREN